MKLWVNRKGWPCLKVKAGRELLAGCRAGVFGDPALFAWTDIIRCCYLSIGLGPKGHGRAFGAVVVHLEGKLRTWIDYDAFDLKAPIHDERFVAAPGAVGQRMLSALGPLS